MEIRDISGYGDRFAISEDGRLYNRRTGKELSQTINNGYYCHMTRIGGRKGKCVLLRIHRLVAEAFHENRENKPQVNHIDGNKLNNHKDNLEWSTPSENVSHSYRTGLHNPIKGSDNVGSKLTDEIVLYCREVYKPRHKEFGLRALARKFGVNHHRIYDAVKGNTWSHV